MPKYLTDAEAIELFPWKPSLATIRRWRTEGVHGIKLEGTRVGGRRVFVTPSAIDRFIRELSKAEAERLQVKV